MKDAWRLRVATLLLGIAVGGIATCRAVDANDGQLTTGAGLSQDRNPKMVTAWPPWLQTFCRDRAMYSANELAPEDILYLAQSVASAGDKESLVYQTRCIAEMMRRTLGEDDRATD